MSIFSENLKFLRNCKELTQTQLSKSSGVSQAAISQLETGERIATKSMIFKLCKVFECNAKELTGSDHGLNREQDMIIEKVKKANSHELEEINLIIDYVMQRK
jgi:transcriptional regulator with XRE-family HTH domain